MTQSLTKLIEQTKTPYSVHEHNGRYYLRDGSGQPNQYGGMDRETASRIYRMFRDAWVGA
jgi:hypothetical protein